MPHHHSTCPQHIRYRRGCTPCRVAARNYWRRRQTALHSGDWQNLIAGEPLEQLQLHVRRLVDAGMSTTRIESTSGVSQSAVRRILHGRSQYVRPVIADALWHVSPPARLVPPRRGTVPAAGTMRRLQALAVEGWAVERLAALCGLSEGSMRVWRVGKRAWIEQAHHDAVKALFEKIMGLDDVWGGSLWMSRHAVRHGWLPAERWADDVWDDPDATPLPVEDAGPDEVAVQRLLDVVGHNGSVWADAPADVQDEAARRAYLAGLAGPSRLQRLLGCGKHRAAMLVARAHQPS